MATLSSVLAWKIPWTEEPGGLQLIGSQRGRHVFRKNSTSVEALSYLISICIPLSLSSAIALYHALPA